MNDVSVTFLFNIHKVGKVLFITQIDVLLHFVPFSHLKREQSHHSLYCIKLQALKAVPDMPQFFAKPLDPPNCKKI